MSGSQSGHRSGSTGSKHSSAHSPGVETSSGLGRLDGLIVGRRVKGTAVGLILGCRVGLEVGRYSTTGIDCAFSTTDTTTTAAATLPAGSEIVYVNADRQCELLPKAYHVFEKGQHKTYSHYLKNSGLEYTSLYCPN